MKALNLFVLTLSFIAYILSIEKTCKIAISKGAESDKDNNTSKKEDHEGNILESMTPLGLGVSASGVASFIYSASDDAFGSNDTLETDFIMSIIIFTLLEILGFIISFYITYGILSIFKSHSGNEQARRNTAGWITVVISFILLFIAFQLEV